MKALVRLGNPEYHDRAGFMHIEPKTLEWQEVKFLVVDKCDHVETMCDDCIDLWLIDHEVHK